MARLADFKAYLDDRHGVLTEIEQRLCALQARYEDFFAEVSRVRESELAQLSEHTLQDRSRLPQWFNEALDSTQAEVERELDGHLAALAAEHARQVAEAETLREQSLVAEEQVKSRNRELDAEEEALKLRNQELLRRIKDFNRRIRALGRGFGFFANFFRMRSLARERRALDDEARDVAARIEALRARWQEREQEHTATERQLQERWVAAESEAAAVAAKLEILRHNRPRMVVRSTLERVLERQQRELAEATEGDPVCGRCRVANPADNHFCHICAARLGDDRPDFAGSLEEMAELNAHHRRFSDGMQACQEIIGLLRGLKSGVENFTASVSEMEASERKYPLAKLQIDVPQASRDYGTIFDRLKLGVAQDLSLHPVHFARQVSQLIADELTEAKIQSYFETMGEELSRQAAAQWE